MSLSPAPWPSCRWWPSCAACGPSEAEAIGAALIGAGFRILEVPLNSPDPFASIRLLADASAPTALVGAGTVIDPDDVARLHDARGRLVVMPAHRSRA